MPIPPKKKEEFKQPELVSWQSFVFLGLVATAATGIMMAKGGFKMNRNLNVMQRFVTKNADSWDKFVEHTPATSHKNKIFQQNVSNIVETAQKIAESKIPEKADRKHGYPKPTFAPQTSLNQRKLLSSKKKDDNKQNEE